MNKTMKLNKTSEKFVGDSIFTQLSFLIVKHHLGLNGDHQLNYVISISFYAISGIFEYIFDVPGSHGKVKYYLIRGVQVIH